MSNTIDDTIQELRDENVELKLGSIRKELIALKTDLHRHLDVILEQTSKTNGSVADALKRLATLEREDNKQKIDNLEEELIDLRDQYKSELKFFRVLGTNRWVIPFILFPLIVWNIPGVSEFLFQWIKNLV